MTSGFTGFGLANELDQLSFWVSLNNVNPVPQRFLLTVVVLLLPRT